MKTQNHFSPRKLLRFTLLLTPFVLAACGKNLSTQTVDLSNKAVATVGCKAFEDNFWDGLYGYSLDQTTFASREEVRAAFTQGLQSSRFDLLTEAEREQLGQELVELYDLLAFETDQLLPASARPGEKLELLSSLEMGDRTTAEKEALQEKIRERFAKIEAMAKSFGVDCTAQDSASESAKRVEPDTRLEQSAATLLGEWKAKRHPAVYGGLKTLATAYQSCEAGVVNALDSSTKAIRGISIVGTHPNGVGRIRKISDLKALIASHPYLANYRKPGSSCASVLTKPLIYDYGGKPSTTNAQDSRLDLFKDAGTGSETELGIDCSGYVYSSLATAGLKLKASGRLKAVGVHGVNAKMFMTPQSNGLTCLDFPTVSASETLKPGDIIASSGHVVMVETVGADPFGLAAIRDASSCRADRLSVSRFDFTILQSSPSVGGIGINRMRAADYFPTSESMAKGLLEHAMTACKAKFGAAQKLKSSSSANIVRHLGTAECSDQSIRLTNEECVASCEAPHGFEPLTSL
jgi:hypothetical protein